MNRQDLLLAASFAAGIPVGTHAQPTGCPVCPDLDVVVELSSAGAPMVPSAEQGVLRTEKVASSCRTVPRKGPSLPSTMRRVSS
jgi:hypothetical protein